MINWPIEGNDYYVDMIDMTPEERADAVRRAKSHTPVSYTHLDVYKRQPPGWLRLS